MTQGIDKSDSVTEEDEFTKQFRSSLKPRSRRIQPAIMLVILLLSSSIFSSYISDLPTLPVDGEDSPVGCNEDGTYDWEMSHPPTIGPAHFENGELTDSSFDPNLIWRIFTVTELLDSNTEKIESILNASILYSIDSNFSNDALVNSQSNVNSYLFFETNGRNINTYHTLSSMYCEADVISFHILRNHSETQTGGSSEGNGTSIELAEGCNPDGSVEWEHVPPNRGNWYHYYPSIRVDTTYNLSSYDYNGDDPPPILYRNITSVSNEIIGSLNRSSLYQEFRLFGIEVNSGWNISEIPPIPELFDNRSSGKYKLEFLKPWEYVVVDEEIDNTTQKLNLTIKPNDGYLFLLGMMSENGTIQSIYQIARLSMWELLERVKNEFCHQNIDSFQRIKHYDNWRSPATIPYSDD